MNGTEKSLSQMDPDTRAIIEHAMYGTPLDPEVGRRIHERSEKATQELFEKNGFLNVAVDLKSRDEE
jgi:hypothetical protein